MLQNRTLSARDIQTKINLVPSMAISSRQSLKCTYVSHAFKKSTLRHLGSNETPTSSQF